MDRDDWLEIVSIKKIIDFSPSWSTIILMRQQKVWMMQLF